MYVKVLILPYWTRPDDFVKRRSKKILNSTFDYSQDFVLFKAEIICFTKLTETYLREQQLWKTRWNHCVKIDIVRREVHLKECSTYLKIKALICLNYFWRKIQEKKQILAWHCLRTFMSNFYQTETLFKTNSQCEKKILGNTYLLMVFIELSFNEVMLDKSRNSRTFYFKANQLCSYRTVLDKVIWKRIRNR